MADTTLDNGFAPIIKLRFILLLAVAIHLPLLLMQLPFTSYDANFHTFFAAHYAQHWFDPWNPKWFTGFSQTTYAPLTHQLIAILSWIFPLDTAYILVQGIVLLLLPVGMYRFARIWVSEKAAGYAALGTIFLGSLSFLVYQAGQLPTTFAAALYLNTLPFLYEWVTTGRKGALLRGIVLVGTCAVAHQTSLIFGAVLYFGPVAIQAILDARRRGAMAQAIARTAIFAGVSAVVTGFVLLPYFIAFLHNPIDQTPIPHASRENLLLNLHWGINYLLVPMGALLLALPFVFWKGLREPRLRVLFIGFYITLIFGLGGTTPIPKLVLGRGFEIVTFERFTFWATLFMLPIAGVLAVQFIERFRRVAMGTLWAAAVATCAFAVSWTYYNPISSEPFHVDEVINYLNQPGRDQYRYFTLGFGTQFARVSTYANPSSVDGDWNSGRMLPEMTAYGAAHLASSKYYGVPGMEALRAMLKSANKYGIKYIFVRDTFYEPLMKFSGWERTRTFDNGNITLYVNPLAPKAQPTNIGYVPPMWQGIMWGLLPMALFITTILLLTVYREREVPVATQQSVTTTHKDEDLSALRQAI